jgi:cytochrome P450
LKTYTSDTDKKFASDSLGFGVDLGALKQEEKTPFAASFDAAQLNVFERLLVPGWTIRESLAKILMPWKTSMDYHVKVVDQFARKVVRDRVAETNNPNYVEKGDLLSRFIQTTNAEGQTLSETELRDILVNFVIAGRDTTAQALSWTFYELMMHVDIQEKLVKEIYEHITDDIEDDPVALYEAIKDMKYAHAVYVSLFLFIFFFFRCKSHHSNCIILIHSLLN